MLLGHCLKPVNRVRGRVLTIHNNPENLHLPARFQRLTFELADVDTQDVSPFFAPSYDFIEGARAAREGARRSKLRTVAAQQAAMQRASCELAPLARDFPYPCFARALARSSQPPVRAQRSWCIAGRA